MSELAVGLFGLGMLAVQAAAVFGIVYAAVRLALRHDREVSS